MKKSFKKKLVLLFCFLYIITDIGDLALVVSAENNNEIVISEDNDISASKDISINGVEDVELEKGTAFDPLNGVEALDKNGVNITSSIEVSGNVDIDSIGDYELIYTAKDELGEVRSITRKIRIIDKKDDVIETTEEETNTVDVSGVTNESTIENIIVDSQNIINVYADGENKENKKLVFSIVPDDKERKLLLVNKSQDDLLLKDLEKNMFSFKIFDKNQKEKFSIDLKAKDNGEVNENSIDEINKKFEKLTYDHGDFIEINHSNPKECLDIQGDILGEISNDKEDYSDGVDNDDYIKNVRFKIINGGLESVYNNEPIIEGISDIEATGDNNIDLLKGIKIIDDHDGIISNEKIQISQEVVNDREKRVIYSITDSWGRSSSANRIVRGSIETADEGLKDNIITVKGTAFSGGRDVRFRIKFDTDKKQIKVIDKDGRSLNSAFKDKTYFSIKIYNKNGGLVKDITLNGDERSNSRKLLDIDSYKYNNGDYISIYHAEADSNKLLIGGLVDEVDYSNGIPLDKIEFNRFQINENKLNFIENEAPSITLNSTSIDPLVVKRGSKRDWLADITITDDKDNMIDKNKVVISNFDIDVAGNQNMKYSYTDSWGKTGTLEREVIVEPISELENIMIDVMDESGVNKLFSLKFDDIKKEIKVIDRNSTNIIDTTVAKALEIGIYDPSGFIKESVTLNGNEGGSSKKLERLDGFKFREGDRISIWTRHREHGIKIRGEINDTELDYSDGFDSDDIMNNTRFNIQEGKFTEIYNNAPIINGVKDITIKRGDKFNPLEKIVVNDDLDGKIENRFVKVIYDKKAIYNVGKTDITYKVTDSWGRETTQTAKLIITPFNKLEDNFIELKNNDNLIALKIGFDCLNNKFNVEYDRNSIIKGEEGDRAFKLEIYNESLSKVLTFEIEKGNYILRDEIKKLKDYVFSKGDLISIWVYDKSKVAFKEIISDGETDYTNGFLTDDIMNNTRFKVTESGLESIYNEAPIFKDFTEETVIIKDDSFDSMDGIRVTDKIDGEIANDNINVSGSVDTGKIGSYNLQYKVKDSWGRETIRDKSIFVVSKTERNTIELKNAVGNKLFKIGYNSRTNNFILSDTSSEQIDDEKLNEIVFTLALYDRNNNEINKLELMGTDPANGEKLKQILDWEVSDNYYISVKGNNPNKIIINGNIIKDSEITEESYEDGIDNIEFMDNVRFKITDEGFKAIYNKAPVIEISGNLNKSKGSSYSILEGVTVSDDHDSEISTSQVTTDKTLSELQVGENTVTYKLIDSWGRKSEASRIITLTNGLLRNEIHFWGYDSLATPKNDVAFKMKFDPYTKRIDIFGEQQKQLLFSEDKNRLFYKITIFDDNKNNLREVSLIGGDRGNTSKTQVLENIPIESGYYFKIYAFQPFRLKITGEVINQREDYSDGVNSLVNINNIIFKVSDNGFEALSDDDDLIDKSRKSIITTATADLQPWKMAIKGDQTFEVFDINNVEIDWGNKNNPVDAFNIRWKNSKGVEKLSLTFRGSRKDSGTSMKKYFDGMTFEDGDYIEVKTLSPRGFVISGNVENAKEDYSDGVNNIENIDHTRFYLTNEGVKAVNNKAPKFIGADDISIPRGEPFDIEGGVSILDDHDKIIEFTASGEVNTNVVGQYSVRYTATDSWGRTTNHNRTILVRPKIYFNGIDILNNRNQAVFTLAIETMNNNNGSFRMYGKTNNKLDTNFEFLNDVVLKIQIVKADGRTPITVELNGSDTGFSEKLERIIGENYTSEDKIRIWAKNNTGVKIRGSIIDAKEDYTDGIQDIDNMNNVAFQLNGDGLTSIYNEAPIFHGVKDYIEIIKGDISFNLKDGITVSDDHDGEINKSKVDINGEFDIDKSGLYNIAYLVTDSWGRKSTINSQVRVLSKVTNNSIDIKSGSESKFKIKFDDKNKRFKVVDKVPGKLDGGIGDNFFKFVVYTINGEIKKEVIIKDNEDPTTSSALDDLNSVEYRNGDMISVWGMNPSNVCIVGDVLDQTFDYSNGFPSEEIIRSVRFTITDDGLKEIKATPITVEGLEDITIIRGETLTREQLLEGVNFENPNEIIDLNNVKISEVDLMTAGTKIITYNIVDSWGKTYEFSRTINVKPYNKVELQKIKVLNSHDGSTIFEVGFDTIDMKFTVDKKYKLIDSFVKTVDNIFKLNVFDVDGINKSSFVVTIDNIEEILGKINNENFEFGDKIQVSSYENENAIEIDWGGTTPSNPGGMGYSEIENVRFDIEEEGITGVYNNAPEVLYNGSKIEGDKLPDIDFIAGDPIDFNANITVVDDKDTAIEKSEIVYNPIDINRVGSHTMTYIVTDTWGRSIKLTREVFIRGRVENYKAVFYSSTTDKLFSLGFDSKEMKLKVIIENDIGIGISDRVKRSVAVTEKIEITQFSNNGKEKCKVNLEFNLDALNKEEIENELNKIKDMNYEYGDYLHLRTTVKEVISDGEISGENYRIELNDVKINNVSGDVVEDYSDGIDNADYMENIRFEIGENSLIPIYNNEPTLNIFNKNLEYYKGDLINLMKGVSAEDDHDNSEEIKITVKDDALKNIGTGEIIYTATDTWGRSSSESIPIIVKNGLLRHTISLGGINRPAGVVGDEGVENIESILDITFDTSGESPKLSFNKRNSENFSDDSNEEEYYSLEVFRENSLNPEKTLIIRGRDTAETVISSWLSSFEFRYNDRIRVRSVQPWRFKIGGYIVNQVEDYSDGVQDFEALRNTEFLITDSGLEAKYIDPDTYNKESEFILAYKRAGNYALKLKYNKDTKRFENLSSSGIFMWNDRNEDIEVFKIGIFRDEELVKSVTFNSLEKVGQESFDNKIVEITKFQIQNGDIIALWDLTEKLEMNRVQIKGKILGQKESYFDGIQDRNNFVNVRFEVGDFTDEEGNKYGLKSIFNTPPVITGESETKIEVGNSFDAMDGMNVTDKEDDIVPELKVDKSDVNTNVPSFYFVEYSATDSWGAKTTFSRDVQVYSMSTITFKNNNDSIIEVGSMKFDELSDKSEYLKKLVEVDDAEDGPDYIRKNLEVIGAENLDLNKTGEYAITYKVVDSHGNITILEKKFQVVKTINVSVPISVPFQVVTNISKPEPTEHDLPHEVITNLNSSTSGSSATVFVSAKLKVKNNNTSPISVSVKEFNKKLDDDGELDIVLPESVGNWDELSKEESLKKMALGIYPMTGLNSTINTSENPVWLKSEGNMLKAKLGNISGRSVISTDINGNSTLGNPVMGELGLVAKHASKFIGGKTKGKFELIFEFE